MSREDVRAEVAEALSIHCGRGHLCFEPEDHIEQAEVVLEVLLRHPKSVIGWLQEEVEF